MSGRRTRATSVAALLVLATVAHAGPSAQLSNVTGQVEVQAPDAPAWRAAQKGEALAPGSVVRTAPGARAELALDGATARLYAESAARVLAAGRGRGLELYRGAALFQVQPRASEPFQVETPNAVALAKGTSFTVTADGDGSSVSVVRGLVGVREPGSLAREFLVHPGFGVIGGAGRPFALGLLNHKGDPWEAWSHGAAPSRPMRRATAGAAPPASRESVESFGPEDDDLAIRLIEARGVRHVRIVGTAGIDATFTKKDLGQVLRGNTALLGSPLIATLHERGVTPNAFARQILDNL